MRKRTRINQQRVDYPDCEGFKGDEGFDDRFFDDEPDYDEELDLPDYERVD